MTEAGQATLGLVQNGCMVHALVVVTVQWVILVPTKGEYRGKMGFLIINNVLLVYLAVSLPKVLTA